ncbi:MAG TPA: xanthine dehydrogenase family protein subunit M [Nocardioidaceae bacterium]|nr:xanthine dehydrogenase family protein subunit M [Nocardioidaceae bacterium]
MKPSPFTYHRPGTVQEAVELLADLGEEGKVLAGGQSLVPLMSMRLAAPANLVDINHLAELDTVEVTGDGVRVGAVARHSRVEKDPAAFEAAPLVRQGLLNVAHPTIRNRGTTVGSLVHADPSAEMPAVLCLLGGSVELRSATGSRTVEAADFFVGPMESALRTGELAVTATFRRAPERSGSTFVELARRHGDYAMCGVAALVTVDPDGAMTGARLALISVGAVPIVVDVAPALNGTGTGFDDSGLRDLVDAAIDPEPDIHATAEYRRHLAHVLTGRALTEARDRAVSSRRHEKVSPR